MTPTLYFGKGFGDLPLSVGPLRAFAVTDRSAIRFRLPPLTLPERLHSAATGLRRFAAIQLPYLKSEIIDLGLPDFINHLIPLLILSSMTSVANNIGNPALPLAPSIPASSGLQVTFKLTSGHDTINRKSGTRRRRYRPIPPLPRRHVPIHPWAAAVRWKVFRYPKTNLLNYITHITHSLATVLLAFTASTAARAARLSRLRRTAVLGHSTVRAAPRKLRCSTRKNSNLPSARFGPEWDANKRVSHLEKAADKRDHHGCRAEAAATGNVQKAHSQALSADNHTTEGTFSFQGRAVRSRMPSRVL